MKVLETRRDGCLTMRRIRKDSGRCVRTMEIPWTMWVHVRPTLMKRIPGYEKTEAARDRVAVIKQMLDAGEKSEYIAAVVGVTGQRVRQIKCRGF